MNTESTTAHAEPIDVVAVMRAAFDALPDRDAAPMYEAIVAVSELMDAAKKANRILDDYGVAPNMVAALSAALRRTGATK